MLCSLLIYSVNNSLRMFFFNVYVVCFLNRVHFLCIESHSNGVHSEEILFTSELVYDMTLMNIIFYDFG